MILLSDDSSTAVIYSAGDYARDERSFSDFAKTGKVDFSAFRRLMLNDLISNSQIIDTGYIGDVRIEDVEFAMSHPKRGWRILQRASEQLMRISPHYYRLNSLYSNMAEFCWWAEYYDLKPNLNQASFEKQYNALISKLEDMNIKHEFAKIMRVLPYHDIYCGLVVENSMDFFFQQIDFKICELYQVQDGLYNFRINLPSIKARELNAYPDYVQQAYLDYAEGRNASKWYTPPADKQICIKMNTQWTYPYPMLISLIRDIIDLDTYKKLKLQSARTDNYKAILVKVPIDEDSVDKPLITPETLGIFAEINRESMSDDIGLIHTLGSDGQAISFKDSNNTRNNVTDAVNDIYDSSGQTREYFNGSSSGTAVTFSVENDAGFVYGVYRQLERWVNRFIKLRKYSRQAFKFKFYLLDVTIFNIDTVSKRYREASNFGAAIKPWLATLGMTPARTVGGFDMDKKIFDFQNNLIPLASAYNGAAVATGNGEGGRPRAEENGETLDVEGEATRDGDKNDR